MRRRPISTTLLGVLLAVATAAAAAGQTAGPVASGEFSGTIAVTGGFSADIGELTEIGSGTLGVTVDAQGPLELVLVDGEMSGTWSLNGLQATVGSITASSGGASTSITVEGGGPINGSGTIGGPPTDYRLNGSVTSSNTITVSVAVIGSQTRSSTNTTTLNEPLTDVVLLCQDIYGRWDLNLREQIEEVGFFEQNIRGYFIASTGIDATEQAQEVEALVADIGAWASDAATVESGQLGAYLTTAYALLGQAQELQAELTADAPCPPDPTFVTALTLAAQDALSTLIARFPGITRLGLTTLALGTGAIGAGSPAPETADALQDQMESDVNQSFDEAVDDLPDSEADLVGLARTAQSLGMETIGSSDLSPADVLLVLTGSSS